MSQSLLFEGILEKINAGTITAAEISDIPCTQLTTQEKQALFQALADKALEDGAVNTVIVEFKGEQTGGTLDVPAFLSGQIRFIDVDNTKQIDHAGTTEFVTDGDLDVFAEDGGLISWQYIRGRFYKARTLTIPAGVRVAYLFSLV